MSTKVTCPLYIKVYGLVSGALGAVGMTIGFLQKNDPGTLMLLPLCLLAASLCISEGSRISTWIYVVASATGIGLAAWSATAHRSEPFELCFSLGVMLAWAFWLKRNIKALMAFPGVR